MEKEALFISVTKLILSVSLIVEIGALIGMFGYLLVMPKNIQQEKEEINITKLFSQETQIIETQFVKSRSQKKRAIVLWMIDPEKNEKTDDVYTCPEITRGSYYQGRTRVSLVDLEKMRIINTIKVISSLTDKDEFYIPYQIRDNIGLYFVREKIQKTEGKPVVIKLKDYNKDTKALEFAFFDSPSCISPLMTILGYSENKDKIIQYDFNLKERTGDNVVFKSKKWISKVFLSELSEDGFWKAKNDTCGRGGMMEKSKISYNQEEETFEGELEIISCDLAFSIEISSPSEGEIWKVGKSYDILWKPKNENNRIDIRLYNNDASDNATRLLWQPSNVSNTGKYTFDVSENMKNGDRYQLEITEYDSSDSYNFKSGEFSIIKE